MTRHMRWSRAMRGRLSAQTTLHVKSFAEIFGSLRAWPRTRATVVRSGYSKPSK